MLDAANIKFYALQKPQKTWNMFKNSTTQSQTIQSCMERECLFLGVKAPLGLTHVTFTVTPKKFLRNKIMLVLLDDQWDTVID